METGKPVCAPVHISSAAAQTEKRMDVQAPLTAVYIHTVPALPALPFPQLPAAAREPAKLHLAMPPLYSKENLRFLTLHIAGGLHSSPGLSPAAAAPTARPKSAGKHVCPHCGRDCMKPSVLEKHLRCHTGERPYPCTTCGVSFKTQSNLYKHKRTQAHARLSSESEQSSLGSLDSMSSSRETHSSSLSLDEHSEETGSMEKDATLPAAEMTCPADTTEVFSLTTQGSVCEQRDLAPASHKTDSNESAKVRKVEENLRVETEQSPSTVGRHVPLQRQKATVFSKQWERSVSRGKSQNHESTDSGFSESSDHYPSPGSVLHGHSLDSLTESNKEHLEETTNTHTSTEPDRGAREQEQKTLEERISKLISENTAVVEDKQLENARPRKTVLSKQGSIDLPLPYTYKDSFHFDMKISRTPNVGLQRNRKPGLYSSVPTQQSTAMEHGPLTRSSSLPFSVTLLQPERSSSAASYQSNYESLVCRGSSGQINPAGFAIKPVNQQSSTHRPLVRQTAVDCNHATDGLFMNSSVEEASTGSLSCDGDLCGEPSNRKFRRKKAQKFAYDKWYMYGGGTFTKLYNTEKDGDKSVVKGRKCMNTEHEAFQAPQKKLSSAHKETITTGSVINIPSSRATVCHPGCSPARTSLSSTVDVNVRTTQLYSPCSSVKSPIRRNLSLSILPLPSVGSLVSHEADSMSSTGAGPKEEHSDSISKLCGAHVPSDRKKQRTADESICQLEMETAPNTLSYPPPSVTGSALRQDAHFSYVNLQKTPKHTQLKGALFSPCIINANTLSVSTLPPTSLPSAVKTSFLPKYQLKLPNAGEHDSNTSLHVVDKRTVTGGCTFTSPESSSKTEQTSPLATAPEIKLSDPVTSALMQTADSKKTNGLNSTQAQLFMPCTVATFCQAGTSRFNDNMTSSLPVVHKQFAATTITTACLHDYQEGLCSTLIQPSKSAPVQLPSPVAPVVAHFPAIPSISTANNQTSATSSTTITQCRLNSNLPLSHLQFLPESEQSSFVNRAFSGPNTPKVPCHIVPCDQVQPAGQNVFHVHTADLQICLQIISDEQLALIEPQIERHEDSSLSQRRDMQAQAAEVIQNKAPSSAATERSNEGTNHRLQGYQKELDQNESLSTLNVQRIEPPLTAHMTEHRNSRQATLSAESKPPEAPGLTTHPHECSHVNTATETLSFASDVMSTAAVRSGRSQTSEEERALYLNSFPEEQPFLGSRVSQGELFLQTLSGLSPNSLNQNSKSELLVKDIHQKPKNQEASCEASIMKTKCEASAYRSSRLESGGTPCSMHVRFDKASTDEVSGSLSPFSINNCKAPRKLNPHASTCCSIPSDPTISETVDPSKHENTGCDGVGPSDNSITLPEKTLCDSQDVISLAHSQKLFTSESSNIHVERTKDIPAVLTSVQSPTAGILDGHCLVECEVQKEPQKWGHVGIPGQSDCTDWRPKLSQEDRETTHQGIDGQSGGGVMREDKNGRIKADMVPGQLANTESNCRYTALPDMTELEGQDTEVKVDSFKNSWLSEEHLQHLSQTHSGMSEYPLQRPQRALSTSNNLNLPASGSETSLLNSPQPPLEVNNFYFSQQHWESSISRTNQTETLCESNSSKSIKTQAQFKETQNAFSQDTQQTTFSHQERQTLCVQQGHTAGNKSTAEGHSTEVTLGSNKTSGLLADIKISCATHHCQVSHSLQVSQASAGWTGNPQTSNTNMLGYNAGARLKPFTYQEPELDPEDQAPHEYITHSSNSGRTDTTSKYQSFFLAAQLQGYQPAESLTAGVKPVQNCQDSSEDTSSSDDEGKLIIEL